MQSGGYQRTYQGTPWRAPRPTVPLTLGARCPRCYETGHDTSECYMTGMVCYGCGGSGHRAVSYSQRQRVAPVPPSVTPRMPVFASRPVASIQLMTQTEIHYRCYELRTVIAEPPRMEIGCTGCGDLGHRQEFCAFRPRGLVGVPQGSQWRLGSSQGFGAIPMVRGSVPRGFAPRGRPEGL